MNLKVTTLVEMVYNSTADCNKESVLSNIRLMIRNSKDFSMLETIPQDMLRSAIESRITEAGIKFMGMSTVELIDYLVDNF